jgi:DNA-binding Lrp family transcriptional regulator
MPLAGSRRKLADAVRRARDGKSVCAASPMTDNPPVDASATTLPCPVEHHDPVNARILAISEDRIAGFVLEPFREIAKLSGVALPTVLERIRAMLRAGTIRRVRQTLLATNLASGALVAWKVPEDRLNAAFDFMFQQDPFSGHVVLRSTDAATAGSDYKLWTTLKAPRGFSLEEHAQLLTRHVGADHFRLMPAKGIFALGVGHVRRKSMEPGARADAPAEITRVVAAELDDREWRVLLALKREFTVDEIHDSPWPARAREAGVSLDEFCAVAKDLEARKLIGRFSTFLEHVKPSETGVRVTRFNALFHWAVPAGREIEAGGEVGRHLILTHCYWREGGPDFKNVNIMAVAHGTEKDRLLAHKAAIDEHLRGCGIPVSYTNVFWGGRSEIKPSEISPFAYREWKEKMERAVPL